MTKHKDGLPVMAMDNFNVDVTARGSAVLEHTLELALAHHSLVEAYVEVEIDKVKTLLLYWALRDVKVQSKFAYPFRQPQILPFIMGWLENQDYGEEPDLDGSCSKGWRLFTNIKYEDKKRLKIDWGVSFAIQPVWAEHHK